MIWIGFVLAGSMALIQSALFPSISLFAFAPYIALCCMNFSLKKAVWLAALGGLATDLMSSDPLGIHALSATIICAFLHRFRLAVFKDLPLQLCFYTAIISALTIFLELILLFLFDRRLLIAGKSIILDLIQMPLINAAYAFLWFVGPLLLWEWGLNLWKRWRRNEAS
jgi:rod shape-determining protein MreD